MYVWSDTDKKSTMASASSFTDTEKSNWTWDEVAQQYYWHRFFSHQPDLNFDNPRVRWTSVLTAMRFWLDLGVDALPAGRHALYSIERDGTSCENVPETHVKIKQIRAVIDAEYENRVDSGRGQPCGRPMCVPTSATATSATWRSTFR